VSTGYAKKMLVLGVGYTAKPWGTNGIEFTLGLSHKVQHQIPQSVTI
jgi:ribosomal protein L6P/L9E